MITMQTFCEIAAVCLDANMQNMMDLTQRMTPQQALEDIKATEFFILGVDPQGSRANEIYTVFREANRAVLVTIEAMVKLGCFDG